MIDIDSSELKLLAADLGDAPSNAGKFIRKAVEVTSRYIRDDWREPLKGSSTLPGGAMSVTYDLGGSATQAGSVLVADIGPELGRGQGALIGPMEYGSFNSAPRGFGLAALQNNLPDFEKGLAQALVDATEGKKA